MSFLYACLMRSVCLWNLNPTGLVLFRSCFIFYIGVTLTSCFFPVVSAFNCLFSNFITLSMAVQATFCCANNNKK